MEFKKNKKLTREEKEEIVAYSKEHGIKEASIKYRVWPDNIKYWSNAELREKVKAKQREQKISEETKQRKREYSAERYKAGLSQEYRKQWYNKLPEEKKQILNEYCKQHRLDNIDKYRERSKQQYLKERDEGRLRVRYINDPVHKLRCNIREHVRQALKYSNVSKTHSSIKYLGCSIEEFRSHIESQFREGMSWENHSRGEHCWHLDHIKPLATLKDITDEVVLKEICHYTNYQPLWEKENLSKQDKYSEYRY